MELPRGLPKETPGSSQQGETTARQPQIAKPFRTFPRCQSAPSRGGGARKEPPGDAAWPGKMLVPKQAKPAASSWHRPRATTEPPARGQRDRGQRGRQQRVKHEVGMGELLLIMQQEGGHAGGAAGPDSGRQTQPRCCGGAGGSPGALSAGTTRLPRDVLPAKLPSSCTQHPPLLVLAPSRSPPGDLQPSQLGTVTGAPSFGSAAPWGVPIATVPLPRPSCHGQHPHLGRAKSSWGWKEMQTHSDGISRCWLRSMQLRLLLLLVLPPPAKVWSC